jgi:putative transcriptional regulator
MMSLKGQFLVAMPEMGDDRFRETVIFLVGHGDEGAMGLVVNRRLDDMRFADILEELKLGKKDEIIRLPSAIKDRDVLRGGPVQRSRGFVLHSTDYFRDGNSYSVSDEICLTATLDILKAMAFGPAPSNAIFALGYCGWSPGQLENEIKGNGWLTVPFSRDLLFSLPLGRRYDAALGMLGITRASLSGVAGRA